MSSRDHSSLLDLSRGLPTTEQDVAVLARLRYRRMTDDQYVRFLKSFPSPDAAALRAKAGPRGRPFHLR